jgi:acetyl esterase/lipase
MTTNSPTTVAVLLLVLFGAPDSARSQNDVTATLNHISNVYTLVPNITYRTVSNWKAKLDVIQPRGLTAPNPTLIYYHGGGWTAGTKESATISFLPYLQVG